MATATTTITHPHTPIIIEESKGQKLKDYRVVVNTGGRGSGKSVSMTWEGIRALLLGYNVWANYPLRFAFRFPSGKIKYYQAKDIAIKDIASFNPEIKNGFVLLDELNLWLSSRRSTSLLNQLAGGWLQLIRKRYLSINITCQFFHTLDKLIKEQVDLIVECFDLSYKYLNLKRGAYISQMITSYSGYGTGRPLFANDDVKEWKRNTITRIFHAQPFWDCYDSWSEYDILKAMTKYEVKRDVVVIGDDGNGDGHEDISDKVIEMTQTHCDVGVTRVDADKMPDLLKEWGVNLDLKQAGIYLKKAGWRYNPRHGKSFYSLPVIEQSDIQDMKDIKEHF